MMLLTVYTLTQIVALNFRLKVNMVIYVNKVNSDAQSKVDNSLVSCLKNVLLSINLHQ